VYGRVLIVTKCEVVSPALGAEIKSEAVSPALDAETKGDVKMEEEPFVLSKPASIVLKPRQDVKSASQIVSEQRGK
jgi:replication factor A1